VKGSDGEGRANGNKDGGRETDAGDMPGQSGDLG